MIKQVQINLEDSNCAKIGSPEDKAARKAAALTEPAWKGAGQETGLQIWRIEKFQVKPWPKEEYGNFYEGDCYIVMRTTKSEDVMMYDIFFWLGLESTQDEQGTAAYKTVELDDLLDGAAVQHREVMLHEGKEFKALFDQVNYLKGGIESGFRHVATEAYVAKLLQVKRVGHQTNAIQVQCAREKMNTGDAFILDDGRKIFLWTGAECSNFEANYANMAAERMESERSGKAEVTREITGEFWEKLGGEGPITPAAEAEPVLPELPRDFEMNILCEIKEGGGGLDMSEIARGDMKLDMLRSGGVYLCDTGPSLLIWIGSAAAHRASAAAMDYANRYIKDNDKPLSTDVTVLKEGHTASNKHFAAVFT